VGELVSFSKNKWLYRASIALGAVLVLLVVFGAGFLVGRWSAPPFGPFSPFPRGESFRSGHGAIGTIQEIKGQTITIQTRDGKIQTILVSGETRFDRDFQKISFGDLKINDQIFVIGSPNAEGQINARVIGIANQPARPPHFRDFPSPDGSK
jgi:hypothetical protein